MTSSVNSPADVVNLALAAIGYQGRVGSLYDGSAASKRALDLYAETRDEVLRQKDWPFALRNVQASAASSTVPGWAYSWAYPSDCIRIRSVEPHTIPSPNYDPRPLLWTLFNDVSKTPPIKVILSQVTPVNINYVGQVTDMTLWEPLFVDAVVQAIAKKLAPSLAGQPMQAMPEVAVAIAAGADDMLSPDDAASPPQPQMREAKR